MKNKDLLMKGIACLLLIPCFIIPFLQIFGCTTTIGNTTSIVGEYGIFADYTDLSSLYKLSVNGTLSPFWMTLVSILVVTLAVFALGYIITFVLELAKAKCKHLKSISKFLGFAILICAILTLVTAVLAVIINTKTYVSLPGSALETKTTMKLVFAVGSWLLISPAIAGILAITTKTTKPAKKSKKK